MTSFVHVEFPKTHGGVERVERAVEAAGHLRKGWTLSRGIAGMLLAAVVSALLVVADQLMDTWADGHLLAAWVLLWVIGFAAVALLAPAARVAGRRAVAGLDRWSQNVARHRADERLWDLARRDPRVLADLQAAASRAEAQA
jgi:hypothetical protein